MMSSFKADFIIVKGGCDVNLYDPKTHILELECNDFYEGLPEKIVKTYAFINQNMLFDKYLHICKLDEDMIIHKLLDVHTLGDYCGTIQSNDGNRRWHIGRCSAGCRFNDEEYKGIFVPWCKGGYGYVLSKYALGKIATDSSYYDEIYEDLYIGKILHINNVFPKHISDFYKYISSPEHSSTGGEYTLLDDL